MEFKLEEWITDRKTRCGNCHKLFKGDDKYCRYCGTKRGEVAFKPYRNIMQCIYGPMPVKRVRECTSCKKRWQTVLMIDDEDFCPDCGAPAKIIDTTL